MSNHDLQSLRSFVKAASQSHPNLHYANVGDTLWGLFLLELTQDFVRGPSYSRKTLVTCVGRQPSSGVWVFNESIQIDDTGSLVSPDNQEYFWQVT